MNEQNSVNSNIRIWYATALLLGAVVCLVHAEANRTPQQQYIDLCIANYDTCAAGCGSNQTCIGTCRAEELTCFNNTIGAIAPVKTPPPNATVPPGAASPNPTATPRKTRPRPPHKGLPTPTPTASHPILLSKQKPTPTPTPKPASSPHNKDHHH